MAEKQESPFTNTRLMIAGVVLGIVGAILIFIYARMKINEATGGTVTVYFMAQDLAKEEELQERHVEARQMPGMFVQGDFTLATVKGGVNKLSKITGIKPIRDLKAGEPVVLLNFPYSADLAMAPQPPVG